MPTDKVDNLFAFTKLQILRERVTIFLEVLKKKLKLTAQHSRFKGSRKQIKQKKKTVTGEGYVRAEYLQINNADITKRIKLGPSLHF